jgi:CBS domain-containing protein
VVNEVEQDPGPASHPVSVKDAIRTAVLVRETATLREVASLMLEQQVDNVVVVDANGAVRGVVSDRHLTLNQTYLRLSSIKVPRLHGRWVTSGDEVEAACVAAATTTAAEVMDRRLTTAEVLEPIGSVVERMLRRDAEYALVLRDGDVVGLFGRRELLRLVAGLPEAHPVSLARSGAAQHPVAHLAAHVRWPVPGWLAQVWQ